MPYKHPFSMVPHYLAHYSSRDLHIHKYGSIQTDHYLMLYRHWYLLKHDMLWPLFKVDTTEWVFEEKNFS